jgi:hypothetical protein
MKERRVKQVVSKCRYQCKGRGHKERVNEDECGGCILYSYVGSRFKACENWTQARRDAIKCFYL